MSEQEQFMDIPKAKGFNSPRLTLIVSIILIVGVSLTVYAIFQKPGGDNTDVANPSGMAKALDPNTVKGSDDEINKIINNPEHSKLALAPVDVKESPLAQAVPPIAEVGPDAAASKADSVDEMRKQIIQAKNQDKIKRAQAGYAAYASKSLINLKGSASGVSGSNPIAAPQNKVSATNVESTANSDAYSSAILISPKSPYELKAGTLIPCVMISGLNSEISGSVKGQVTENVYDSVRGRYVLIPQGSILIGKYTNAISYGSSRIGVGWSQLIMPNGDSFDLKGLPGSDLSGFEGFSDIVDNHYWKLFGTSFIMGVITAGMQYSQNNTNANVQSGGIGLTTNPNPTVGQTLSGSLGQQLGQTGLAITNKNLNVAPTIIIRQGMQFNVMLTATLILRPYKV
jgi:type IV secretion system protein VirB10